jgi:hypothetical protein
MVMKKSDEQKILDWLREHDLIKHLALEKKCGMPQGCIYKAMNGRISLPEKHMILMVEELQKYGLNMPIPVLAPKLSNLKLLAEKTKIDLSGLSPEQRTRFHKLLKMK